MCEEGVESDVTMIVAVVVVVEEEEDEGCEVAKVEEAMVVAVAVEPGRCGSSRMYY